MDGYVFTLLPETPGTRVPVQMPDGYPGTKIPESPSTIHGHKELAAAQLSTAVTNCLKPIFTSLRHVLPCVTSRIQRVR